MSSCLPYDTPGVVIDLYAACLAKAEEIAIHPDSAMPNVKFRASRRTLTSHAGLSIIGQCFEIAGVDSIDGRFPTTLGMRTSD